MGQAQLEITNTGSQEVSISHMFNHAEFFKVVVVFDIMQPMI